MKTRYKLATIMTAILGVAVYLALHGSPFSNEQPFQDIRPKAQSIANSSGTKHDGGRDSSAVQFLGSRAGWNERRQRFNRRDFAWIVETAYDAPEEGSYVFASRALSTCRALYLNGTLAQQTARIAIDNRFSEETNQERQRAVAEMFGACQPLGSADQMLAMLKRLAYLTRDGPDMVENTLVRGNQLPNLPREQKAQRVAQMLEMNDAIATQSIIPTLTAPDATLNGIDIGRFDLPAYRAAWNLTICAQYGDCQGAGSTEGLQECIQWGTCDYPDTWTKVDRAYPAILRGKIQSYFLSIRANLQAGNYAAFGAGSFNQPPSR